MDKTSLFIVGVGAATLLAIALNYLLLIGTVRLRAVAELPLWRKLAFVLMTAVLVYLGVGMISFALESKKELQSIHLPSPTQPRRMA